jgi:hypothetical protein
MCGLLIVDWRLASRADRVAMGSAALTHPTGSLSLFGNFLGVAWLDCFARARDDGGWIELYY